MRTIIYEEDHINNGPYQLLKKDPTTKIKTKTLKQLKVLKDNKFIDNKLYYYLKPADSPAPRFYFQLQILKPGVPIRPIVSYSASPLYNLNQYIANILKAYVRDENNNAKNSTMFSNYIRNVPIKDDEIMVLFEVTSLYTNIPIIDTLNIIKNYVNDDQFSRKTAIPQDKFLDLVHLVLTTTLYTFNSQFYQQTDGISMGGSASSTTAKNYMQAYECTAITTCTLQKFGNGLLMMFILSLNVRIWKTFSIISTIFIKRLSLLWRKNAVEN